jgi:formate dehydrogenase major subunit
MNALRGHSNIQGLTDIGLMSNLMPGYLTLADRQGGRFYDLHVDARIQAAAPNQMSYWQNYKKFLVSFLKSMWGKAATAENDWAYQWLPKLDVPGYDMLRTFDLMHQGKVNGYFCQGFNPLLSFPEPGQDHGLAVEAEVPGGDGPAADRNGAVLEG